MKKTFKITFLLVVCSLLMMNLFSIKPVYAADGTLDTSTTGYYAPFVAGEGETIIGKSNTAQYQGTKFFDVGTYEPMGYNPATGKYVYVIKYYIVSWYATANTGYCYPDVQYEVLLDGEVVGKYNYPTGTSHKITNQVKLMGSMPVELEPGKTYTVGLTGDGKHTDIAVEAEITLPLPKYNITYNLNGGNVSKANPTTYTQETATFTLNNPSKTGYTFTGWTETLSTSFWVNLMCNASTGNVVYNSNYPDALTSEMLRVEKGVTYTIANDTTSQWGIRFYDTSGTHVSNSTIKTGSSTYTPTSDGYIRICYFYGYDGTGPSATTITSSQGTSVPIVLGSTGNRSYTANWEVNKYTVTYKANGGSGSDQSQSITYGTKWQAKAATTFTRTGYTLSSWNTEADGSGAKITPGLYQALYKNVTLYAQWEPNTIKITLNKNGGSGGTDTFYYKYGINKFYSDQACTNQITSISRPSRTGYTFVHYYGDGSSGGTNGERYVAYDSTEFASDLSIDIYKDATLYAKWSENTYSVKYYVDGSLVETKADIKYTDAFTLRSATSKTGYTWTGWNTSSSYNGTSYNPGDSVSKLTSTNGATISLYGKNTVNNYTATFDANGGTTANPSSIKKAYGAQLGTLPTTSRTGYTFNGWYTAKTGGTKISTTTTMPLNGATYYAQWTKTPYTVTVNKGTGISSVSGGGTYYYGDSVTVTATASAGYKEPKIGSNASPYTFTMGTSNVTLNTSATPITYYVRFNGNGATGSSMNNQTFTYGTAQTLTANTFTRAYTVTYNYNGNGQDNSTTIATYSFKNWNRNAAGTSTTYTNKQSVSNLTTTDGGIVDVYAQWNSASVTLPTPTARAGYTFGGWYGESSLKNKVGNAGDAYTPTTNTTLYAKWNPNIIKVTLDNQGATTVGTPAYWYQFNTTKVIDGVTVYYYSDSTLTTPLNKGYYITIPQKTGYTFGGYYTETNGSGIQYVDANGQCVNNLYSKVTSDITLYAKWTPAAVAYKVEHYQMNTSGAYPTSATATDHLTANTGSSVTPSLKYTTGFTLDTEKSTKTPVTISADGSTVIKYYYKRNQHTVNANKGTGIDSVSGGGKYYYGANVSVTASVNSSYKWNNWTGSYTSTANPYTFTMPDKDVSLTANGTINTSSLTVKPNGGTWNSNTTDQTFTQNIGSTKTIADPVAPTGYAFNGWTHSGDGTWNASTKVFTFGTSNGTLTANYKGKTFTLSYDANGGSGAPEKQAWTYGGDNITISTTKPTRTGYTFLGWSTSSTATSADSSLDPGDIVSSTKWSTNKTLYAVWKVNSYSVTANAGTGVQSITGADSYNYGSSVTMGITLKPGYKWDENSKWTSSNTELLANSTNQTYKFNMPAGDITLTASASPIRYTVEYYKDGTLYKTVSATYDKAFTTEAAPTVATGYIFSGWYTSSDLTGTNYAAESSQKNLTTTDGATIKLYGKTIAQSVTYKVQHWQEKLNVTPTAENSTYYTLVSDDTRILTAAAGSKVSPEVKSYMGFQSPSKKTVTVAGDGSTVVNYYYTRNSYTVSLKVGPGVTSVSGEGTYDYGATVSIDAIVKENNTWACWISSDPELVANSTDQKYTFVIPAGNVTLTATADANAYTVAFDANGGTEVTTILEKKEGEALGDLPITTREGFIFDGWFTDKTDGTKISESTKMPASNVTYYAHWTVIPPELETKKAYYFQDAPVTSVDLIKNATASDIVDGDISSEVVIHKIKYPNGTEKVSPTTLDTSKLGEVTIEYKVSNERGAEVKQTNTVTIVKKGSSIKEDANKTNVYFRFISNLLLSDGVQALDTLEEHSIWDTNLYNQLLRNSLGKNKGDYLVEYEYINQ